MRRALAVLLYAAALMHCSTRTESCSATCTQRSAAKIFTARRTIWAVA